MKVKIYNPSSARRIIHNGMAESRAIEILPRKTIEEVELADHVIERLQKLAALDQYNELQVTPLEDAGSRKMQVDDSKIGIIKASPVVTKGKR